MEDEEFTEFKKKLEEYTPMIPNSVIESYCERCGIETLDEDVKKTISLLSHKFLTDVAIASFQYHKIFAKNAQKDKRFEREKKVTLQIQDLEKALKELGIDISRPNYFL